MNQNKHEATIRYNHTLPELEQQVKDAVDEYVQDGYLEDNFNGEVSDMIMEISDSHTPVLNADLLGLWIEWGDRFKGYTGKVGVAYGHCDTKEDEIKSDIHFYLEDVAREYYNENYHKEVTE